MHAYFIEFGGRLSSVDMKGAYRELIKPILYGIIVEQANGQWLSKQEEIENGILVARGKRNRHPMEKTTNNYRKRDNVGESG